MVSTEWNEASKAAARAQLARILDSPQFRASKRCSGFLRHVVGHALESRLESLKERTIGVEVFERDPNYDTNQDPVVRSTAGEVRKRLAQYYQESGRDGEWRIALPTGSYVPDLHAPPPAPAMEPPPAPAIAIAPPPRPRRRTALAAFVVIFAGAAAFFALTARPTALDRFWDPVLAPKEHLLVCVGQPKVYKFSERAGGHLNRWFDPATNTALPPPPVPLADVVPMWSNYLGIGDSQAFSRLAGFLGRRGKQVDLRGGRTVSLSDLRGRPVVLIGAFNNEWTLSLAGDLRFYFEHDPRGPIDLIRDRQSPANTAWQVDSDGPSRTLPIDYALVTRVRNPTTEQTVVIVAGLTDLGTQAAGEFLTTPEYFDEAVRGAPAGWRGKNMQVVLSAKVMSGTVGPPRVLAAHFW